MANINLSQVRDGREWNFVQQWEGDNWNCYWGEEAADTQVFKPEIQVHHCGLVTFPAAGAIPAAAHATVEALLKVYNDLVRDDTRCDVFGSETDNPYVPVLVPWSSSEPLTAASFLAAIGASEKIKDGIHVVSPERQNWGDPHSQDRDHPPLFEQHSPSVHKLLTRRDGEPLVFYAGSELLNPVPFFAVAQLDNDYAGGFLSALIHT